MLINRLRLTFFLFISLFIIPIDSYAEIQMVSYQSTETPVIDGKTDDLWKKNIKGFKSKILYTILLYLLNL